MKHASIFSVFLMTSAALAATAEFKGQTIAVASDQGWWVTSNLVDVDDDGLTDLLVLLPAQNEVRVFRQRKSGFAATPDQTTTLPEQAAWVAMRDVDPHKGREMVISTAAGIVYLRQDDGIFEASSQTLVDVPQVFAANRLRVGSDAPGRRDMNDAIPVIFEDRVTLYEGDGSYTWRPGRTLGLIPRSTAWQVREERWMRGPASAYTMEIRTSVRRGPPSTGTHEDEGKKAEHEIIERVVKETQWRDHDLQTQDVNGDGREDVVLWNVYGEFNPGVTILLFLRGPDGRLPERPTHVLRHSGIPIRVDRDLGFSPFWDLDGDGRCELILVALKTRVTSWSGMVDIALSGEVDWIFTVRSGRRNDYSGNPDFRMDVASMAPHSERARSLFLIDGDFNGDGREDLLVKRGSEQFDLYLSDAGTGSFQARPSRSFAAPTQARRIETADLNGDGISDLFIQKTLEAQITVYLSQSNPRKGTAK